MGGWGSGEFLIDGLGDSVGWDEVGIAVETVDMCGCLACVVG